MKSIRNAVVCSLCSIFLAGYAFAQEKSSSTDLQDTLNMILQRLETQQGQIDTLSKQITDQKNIIDQQSKLITEQQKIIDDQTSNLAQQIKQFEEQKNQLTATAEEIKSAPAQSDSYGAKLAYDTAWEIYETAIFEVQRRNQRPYFERAIERFREVVTNFPKADKADDAQCRIAVIYQRYLDEPTRAADEWRTLLKLFPTSRFAGQARESLRNLGAKE